MFIYQYQAIPKALSPCGLMDKALASGAKDCGFESHQGRICGIFFVSREKIPYFFHFQIFHLSREHITKCLEK